ncbi:MAG: branched-chain amino acid ABC transporter ATP-binding protein, partial [Thermodesulfobacteriota bacterium]|nr:branched-chain amino acid ABC transporter ATP-binding protein [Thermodesulfobacteriota bacterium]
FHIIKRINEQGVTVLLVEQNVRQALKMCDRAYVLENGRIVLEGAPSDLMEKQQVREAFLGI